MMGFGNIWAVQELIWFLQAIRALLIEFWNLAFRLLQPYWDLLHGTNLPNEKSSLVVCNNQFRVHTAKDKKFTLCSRWDSGIFQEFRERTGIWFLQAIWGLLIEFWSPFFWLLQPYWFPLHETNLPSEKSSLVVCNNQFRVHVAKDKKVPPAVMKWRDSWRFEQFQDLIWFLQGNTSIYYRVLEPTFSIMATILIPLHETKLQNKKSSSVVCNNHFRVRVAK